MRETIAAGEHWYLALLKTMARWDQAEEIIDDRQYRYLVGGEAFDWLLLAERLIDELHGVVTEPEREALLFHGHPPLEVSDEEFQSLIGTPKYQAYLNYLYGVVVEEALQLAVEEEMAKEHHAHVWAAGEIDGIGMFQRIYGHSQGDLLAEFQKERGMAETSSLDYSDLREFTYWLFKYRVRNGEGARVASDTRKGLAALSRLENAYRRRAEPEAPAPEEATIESIKTETERERRARRRQAFAERNLD
jgi:GGDEF domain-containing protein